MIRKTLFFPLSKFLSNITKAKMQHFKNDLTKTPNLLNQRIATSNKSREFNNQPISKSPVTPKLASETPDVIRTLWLDYHKKLDCISAVIDAKQYKKLRERATKCPMFVFPIPKQNGFLSMFCQMIPSPLNVNEDHCKFTALEEFQRKGANAITYLDMIYYTELMESKGLVLLRGTIETLVMNAQEAQYLANMWQLFLLDDDKYKLMEIFNYRPQLFDFQQVVDIVKQAASDQLIYKEKTKEESSKEENK